MVKFDRKHSLDRKACIGVVHKLLLNMNLEYIDNLQVHLGQPHLRIECKWILDCKLSNLFHIFDMYFRLGDILIDKHKFYY